MSDIDLDFMNARATPSAPLAPVPTDGEMYWIRTHAGGKTFIAEYTVKNKDRAGRPAGPCFWVGTMEIRGEPTVIAHIKRPD